MAAIRGRDTGPERRIRKAMHSAGLRFRLHRKDLPGNPDLVFPRHRAVVFVHGCFWHQHDCHLFKWPATRAEFWRAKIGRNVENDARAYDTLRATGWRVAIVWECALKGRLKLNERQMMHDLAEWVRSDSETLIIRGSDLD